MLLTGIMPVSNKKNKKIDNVKILQYIYTVTLMKCWKI